MRVLPHLPALREGRRVETQDKHSLKDLRSGETVARISQVAPQRIREWLQESGAARSALERFSLSDIWERMRTAARHFREATLPLGDRGHTQSPGDYLQSLAQTGGWPYSLGRQHMEKIATGLESQATLLRGLARGGDLRAMVEGTSDDYSRSLRWVRMVHRVAILLPGNSPSVNTAWLPAVALKTPVILRPGREEPWTSWRLMEALQAAGLPGSAMNFWPSDVAGAAEIARHSGCCLAYGHLDLGESPAGAGVTVHRAEYGPSKIVLGDDVVDRWPEFLDVLVESALGHGGRACHNVSVILVPRHGRALAEALAARLGPVAPKAMEDPTAELAAFARPELALAIDAAVESGLSQPGAEDLAVPFRDGPRRATRDGLTFLRPSVLHFSDPAHPLWNREFAYPHVGVLEAPRRDWRALLGRSLVLTAITQDEALRTELAHAAGIHRLHLGPVATVHASRDQPAEGDLLQRIFQPRTFHDGWR